MVCVDLHIKSFKLFESISEFSIKEISDVYNDIKSVEYILDEIEYNFKYNFIISVFSPKYEKWVELSIPDVGGLISLTKFDGQEVKYLGINIEFNIPLFDSLGNRIVWKEDELSKFKSDVLRYFNLLSEHLDYISDISELSKSKFGIIIKVRL